MKIIRIASLSVLASLCLLFSSCTLFDVFSTDTIIRAPKLTGEYAQLQAAFESAVGQDIENVVPVAGEYRSAFTMADFDGNGIDEAVVFYSRTDTDDVVHIHVLSYEDRTWKSLGDVLGTGSGVYEVVFCDLDGDGIKELSVIWTLSESDRDRTLSTYSVASQDGVLSSPVSLSSIKVSDYILADFNGTGGNEIFYTYHSSSAQNVLYAQLLEFSTASGVPAPVTQIEFGMGVTDTQNLVYEKNRNGCRIFADCILDDGTYTTEVIDYNKSENTFTLPLRAISEDGSYGILRNGRALCKDIDSDGKTEIPVEISFPGISAQQNTASKSFSSLIQWSELTDEGLNGKTIRYANYNDNYSLCMDSLYDIAYVTYDSLSRTARWCLAHPDDSADRNAGAEAKDNQTEEILFSVIYTANSADKKTEDNFLIVVTELGKEMNFKVSYIKSLIMAEGEKETSATGGIQ